MMSMHPEWVQHEHEDRLRRLVGRPTPDRRWTRPPGASRRTRPPRRRVQEG